MTRRTYFAGSSGTRYSYAAMPDNAAASGRAGNFVIAKVTPARAEIIFAGETEDLASVQWQPLWDQARREHGATDILIRLNVAHAVRQAEHQDLVAEHSPPMNKDRLGPDQRR